MKYRKRRVIESVQVHLRNTVTLCLCFSSGRAFFRFSDFSWFGVGLCNTFAQKRPVFMQVKRWPHNKRDYITTDCIVFQDIFIQRRAFRKINLHVKGRTLGNHIPAQFQRLLHKGGKMFPFISFKCILFREFLKIENLLCIKFNP